MPKPSWYPMRVEDSTARSASAMPLPDIAPFELTLVNAFAKVRALFEEVGISIQPTAAAVRTKSSSQQLPSSSASEDKRASHKKELAIVEVSTILCESHVHIPGGIMILLDGLRIPTTKGIRRVTRPEVDEFFGNVFLSDLEPAEFIARYTYRELDAMRFSFAAVCKYFIQSGLLDSSGLLTPLAKRDMKSNCRDAASALQNGDDDDGNERRRHDHHGEVSGAARPQAHVKAMLQEECASRWPHTPPMKSMCLSVISDPSQPRHKPLFRATVELTLAKRKFFGQWHRWKMDAENDACSEALKFLHSGSPC